MKVRTASQAERELRPHGLIKILEIRGLVITFIVSRVQFNIVIQK
jgi:hypothetical protein